MLLLFVLGGLKELESTTKQKGQPKEAKRQGLRVTSVGFTPDPSVGQKLTKVYSVLLDPSLEEARTIEDEGDRGTRSQDTER